jgi:hypothetical protein
MDFANAELRAFYEQATRLEPADDHIARVVAAVTPRPARRAIAARITLRRRSLALVCAVVIAASISTVAYPAARDALDAFFNGGSTPGTQAALGELPGWLTGAADAGPFAGSQRLLAANDGERMVAFRDRKTGRACVVFGTDSDTCSDSSEWNRLFAGHAVLKLASGVGPTADGQVAVFGLARSSVDHVELRDNGHPVASAPVTNGGWVIVAPQGQHSALVAVGPSGKTVETLDASTWTWTFCQTESGCQPDLGASSSVERGEGVIDARAP